MGKEDEQVLTEEPQNLRIWKGELGNPVEVFFSTIPEEIRAQSVSVTSSGSHVPEALEGELESSALSVPNPTAFPLELTLFRDDPLSLLN